MDGIPINENKLKDIGQAEQIKKNNIDNSEEYSIRKIRTKSYTMNPYKISFNLNSKYDNALLEELYSSNDKSWRNEIISSSANKNKKKFNSNANLFFDTKQNFNINDNNNINNENIEKNTENIENSNEKIENMNENNEKKNENNENINENANNKDKDEVKGDRFKDFDEILNLEDNKDKKNKNKSEQKLLSLEQYIKTPKKEEIKKNCSNELDEKIIKDNNNLDIIEEVMEKEEKNKKDLMIGNEGIKINKDNKNYLLVKTENENDGNEKNNFDINDKNEISNNSKNEIVNYSNNNNNNYNEFNNFQINNSNSTNENNINRYNSINLEYSEDKKTEEEKEEPKIDIQNSKNGNINNNEENKKINNDIEEKTKETDIKKNDSIHFIDIDNIISERTKLSKNNKKNFQKFKINKKNVIDNTQNNKVQTKNLLNTIDFNESKERKKKLFEKININFKKNIIWNSNTINHIPLIKNKSTINLKKNFNDYFIGDDNKNETKNKNKKNNNIPLSTILYSFSPKTNKNHGKTLYNFFPIKNLKREIYISDNNKFSQNLSKELKIKRIKNSLNNINTKKPKRNKEMVSTNFFEEENYYKKKRDIIHNLKNAQKCIYNEKIKNNKNSFFPLYNNFVSYKKNNNNNENKNELIKKRKFDFFGENILFDEQNAKNENILFYAYSTEKLKKKTNSFFFNEDKNDEFFTTKNIINKNHSRDIIGTNRNLNYENCYKRMINKLNNNLDINYKNNGSSSYSNYKNNSYNYSIYNNKKKLITNFSNNKNYGINFQKYIEKKGNRIVTKIKNLNYNGNGYNKTKTSVFPANPFNSLNI